MLSNRSALLVLLTAALGSAACSAIESSPLEPTVQPPAYSEWSASSGHNGSQGGWGDSRPSSCRPLHSDTESEDIGFRGGELQIGPHRLIVPRGALLHKTRITGRISSDSVNSVQFYPAGLQFLVPARLQLSYENCNKLDLKNMRVVYTSDDLSQLLELIPSEDRRLKNTVVGLISHFSRYAVAY